MHALLVFTAALTILTCLTTPGSAFSAEEIDQDLAARNLTFCEDHICVSDGRSPRPLEGEEGHGCYCDKKCTTYGDCCRDIPYTGSKRDDISCHKLRNYNGVYIVDSCPASYPEAEVRGLCEAAADAAADPMLKMPVSSPKVRLTYKNFYCALCHGRPAEDLVFWRSRVECPTLPRRFNQSLVRDLLYQNSEGLWGIDGQDEFHTCVVDPMLPETVGYFMRSCHLSVSTCPASWQDLQVAQLCAGYIGIVYDRDNNAYRNSHCAFCNGVESHYCFEGPTSRGNTGWANVFNTRAFSLLLDFSPEAGEFVGEKKNPCADNELWDPFFKKCRVVGCAPGLKLVASRCEAAAGNNRGALIPVVPSVNALDNALDNATNNALDNATELSNTTMLDFAACPKYRLNASEFQLAENGSVFIPEYGNTLQTGQYALEGDELVICAVTDSTGKFDAVLSYLSIICLIISIVCLLAHLVAFCLVADLRNLSGKNLTSLCACLLVAHVCFLAPVEVGSASCFNVAVVMYTAYLASFAWMNVMAYDVFVTLRRATRELRVSSGRRDKRYLVYLVYVLLVSVVLLTLVLLAEYGVLDTSLDPDFGVRQCWFGRRWALLLFFAVPLFLLMFFNVIFFVASIIMIRNTTANTARMSCAPSQMNLRLYSRLAVIMGLSWTVGIASGWLDLSVLWYIFTLLNTLQGVFIFTSFTLSDKVRDKLRRRAAEYSGRRLMSSGVTSTSLASSVSKSASAKRQQSASAKRQQSASAKRQQSPATGVSSEQL